MIQDIKYRKARPNLDEEGVLALSDDGTAYVLQVKIDGIWQDVPAPPELPDTASDEA